MKYIDGYFTYFFEITYFSLWPLLVRYIKLYIYNFVNKLKYLTIHYYPIINQKLKYVLQ